MTGWNKPWDRCSEFGCTRKTSSGQKERDPAKRWCGVHDPEGREIKRAEWKEKMHTAWLRSKCPKLDRDLQTHRKRPYCAVPGPLPSGVCVSVETRCTTPPPTRWQPSRALVWDRRNGRCKRVTESKPRAGLTPETHASQIQTFLTGEPERCAAKPGGPFRMRREPLIVKVPTLLSMIDDQPRKPHLPKRKQPRKKPANDERRRDEFVQECIDLARRERAKDMGYREWEALHLAAKGQFEGFPEWLLADFRNRSLVSWEPPYEITASGEDLLAHEKELRKP